MDLYQILESLYLADRGFMKSLGIFLVGYFIARQIKKHLSILLKTHTADPTTKLFLVNAVYAVILVILGIIVLGSLGIPTASLITVLGTSGLAIALALKDSFANIAGGVMIILLKPFKLGDMVEISGTYGAVDQINLYNIRIRTPNNEGVYLPNAKLLSEKINNKTYASTRRLDLSVGIEYSADLLKAKKVVLDCLNADQRILSEPEAKVFVKELSDSAIILGIRPWVQKEDYGACLMDTMERVKLALDAANIGIPFPQLDVHFSKHFPANE